MAAGRLAGTEITLEAKASLPIDLCSARANRGGDYISDGIADWTVCEKQSYRVCALIAAGRSKSFDCETAAGFRVPH